MAIIPLGGGGSENLNAELTTQETLIEAIEEALVGKATGANATANKILKPYKAYVGKNLITGTYVPQVVTIDGVQHSEDMTLVTKEFQIHLGSTPYKYYEGSAVVLNNEIHILGGSGVTPYTRHYKWNGTAWTSVSTLPYDFYRGSAVVLNNEIHILGGSLSEPYHYKWNGSSWTSVSTLPNYFQSSCGVVYNNQIHILGGNYSSATNRLHYKWNGSSWTSVSTLPTALYNGSAVVLNNEIHILYSTYHYKWNGSSWLQMDGLTTEIITDNNSAVVLNNEIHQITNNNHYCLNKAVYIAA